MDLISPNTSLFQIHGLKALNKLGHLVLVLFNLMNGRDLNNKFFNFLYDIHRLLLLQVDLLALGQTRLGHLVGRCGFLLLHSLDWCLVR